MTLLEIKEYMLEYRKKRYYLEHKEELKVAMRTRYDANREVYAARQKRYREDNREKIAASQKAYRSKNKDRHNELNRAWDKANRDKKNAWYAKYRARKIGAEGSHTAKQWRDILAKWGGVCAYCGTSERITKDHIVPLVRGGSDYASNLQPLCLPCNSTKGAKLS
jgi:5-methylcytosine-specific restriction endonuclease McrA